MGDVKEMLRFCDKEVDYVKYCTLNRDEMTDWFLIWMTRYIYRKI